MAQYINREKLLKRMEGYCEANCGCKPHEDALCPSCGLGDAIYMVEEQRIVNTRNMKRRKDSIEELANMRPVVLCKDCVHFQKFRPHDGFCNIDGMLWNNDFFCANGKREES